MGKPKARIGLARARQVRELADEGFGTAAIAAKLGIPPRDVDWALGIPQMQTMIERYAARTGLDDVPDMNWYFAFNLFRLAGIVQGIKKRVIDGNASNEKAAEMAKKVPFLADTAWHFAREAGDVVADDIVAPRNFLLHALVNHGANHRHVFCAEKRRLLFLQL